MNTVSTIEDFSKLPLKTKVYLPNERNIQWWYYAGINPMSNKHVMLIAADSVDKIDCRYAGDGFQKAYYLDYKEACSALYKNAIENVDRVKEIFIDN